MDELRELAKKIMRDYPDSIRLIKKQFVNQDDWNYCVNENPSLFKYTKFPTLEMCKTAVACDASNIFYVPKEFWVDDVVDMAILQNAKILLDFPKQYITMDRKYLAVIHDPSLIEAVGYLDDDFINLMIDKRPTCIEFMRKPTEDQICRALQHNPHIALHYRKLTPKMKRVIEEYWPNYRNILPNFDK